MDLAMSDAASYNISITNNSNHVQKYVAYFKPLNIIDKGDTEVWSCVTSVTAEVDSGGSSDIWIPMPSSVVCGRVSKKMSLRSNIRKQNALIMEDGRSWEVRTSNDGQDLPSLRSKPLAAGMDPKNVILDVDSYKYNDGGYTYTGLGGTTDNGVTIPELVWEVEPVQQYKLPKALDPIFYLLKSDGNWKKGDLICSSKTSAPDNSIPIDFSQMSPFYTAIVTDDNSGRLSATIAAPLPYLPSPSPLSRPSPRD